MRFVYGKIETWTGRALALAHRQQRKDARANESVQEKNERKAARRQAKLEKQQRRQQAAAKQRLEPQLPPDWMQPVNGGGSDMEPVVPNSDAHREFLDQIAETTHVSELDELD
jgi:hypothetical protein